VNVGGTVSLMEAMRDVGVRRVVFISSGAVYGDQGRQPLQESASPNPRSPYAVSKLAAEYYVRTIGDLWGIETVSLRVFNAYGPKQHLPASHPPVIPNFLRYALRGGTAVIHGDGTQTRDYVFIDDVVVAMMAAATAPGINHLVINIGSGVETSIRDLARQVMETSGARLEVISNPRTDPGVSRMCADLTLARDKLGYQPSFSLGEGLRLTLERDPRFRREPPTRPVNRP
jgi:UDP-glucose 4-epimerase